MPGQRLAGALLEHAGNINVFMAVRRIANLILCIDQEVDKQD